ncbi:DUF551 domain-containing protein [Salmonella enterica subsp. enterica]|nr:DUF551 domain-containing protein [Salmonella enterica subsp. enterica]
MTNKLTDERVLQRLSQFEGAYKEACAFQDGDFASECADIVRVLREVLERLSRCHASGAEPVSNHDELAPYYLQGQKDGLEWAAQLAEANHPYTGDWLYDDPLELAKAIRKGPDMSEFAGSSPVIPDGWISCSERMPDREYVLAGDFSGTHYLASIPNVQVGIYADWFDDEKHCWDDGDGNDLHLKEVTHWMPLPEPPQEFNRG